jgi:hypothetical protein
MRGWLTFPLGRVASSRYLADAVIDIAALWNSQRSFRPCPPAETTTGFAPTGALGAAGVARRQDAGILCDGLRRNNDRSDANRYRAAPSFGGYINAAS